MILNPSDFDYLLSRGDSSGSTNSRDSILERFDPLSRQSILPSTILSAGNAVQKRFAAIEEQNSSNDTDTSVVDQPLISTRVSPINAAVAKNKKNIKLDSQSSSLDNCSDSQTTSSSSETYATAPIEPSPVSEMEMWLQERNLLTKQILIQFQTNTTMSVDLIQDMNNDNMKTLEIVR